MINHAKKTLPKLKSEIQESLRKQGLSEEMIGILFKRDKLELYKELYSIIDKPMFVAKVLLTLPKEIASKRKIDLSEVENKIEDFLGDIFRLISESKLDVGKVQSVLERLVEGIDFFEAVKFDSIDLNRVEEFVVKLVKSKPGLRSNAYMGLVMKEFGGKVSGEDAMKIIGRHVK